MTDAEIEYLKFLDFTESEIKSINNFPYFGTPQFYAFKSGYERGFKKGRKENGVVWHDLSKNPLDLPTKNCTVLIYTDWQGVEIETFFSDTRLFGRLSFRDVIAWAEIPTFEGE